MYEEEKMCAGQESAERVKSQNLSQAISEIDDVVDRINGLSDRINGTEQDTVQVDPKVAHEPSLSDVLSSGADHIRDKCNAIHDRLSLIENLLF